MKIAILGCTESFYHDGMRLMAAFERKGHSVLICDFRCNTDAVIAKIKVFAPDFCIVTIGRGYNSEVLKKLSEITYLVHWAYDEYTPAEDSLYADVRGIYHLTMVKSRGLLNMLKPYCQDVVWMPMYYDVVYDGATEYCKDKSLDLLFVGDPHPKQSLLRQEYLRRLGGEDNFAVNIVGNGWDPYKRSIQARYLGCAYGKILSSIVAHAKIGLSFKNDLLADIELGFSDRILKLMGARCFVLMQNVQGLKEVFVPGTHVVTYDTYKELRDKIRYYLDHDVERDTIARQGQELVLREYTIDKVTDLYLQALGERGVGVS